MTVSLSAGCFSAPLKFTERTSSFPLLGNRGCGCSSTACFLRFWQKPRPLVLGLLAPGSPLQFRHGPLIFFAKKKNFPPEPSSVEDVSLGVDEDDEGLEDEDIFIEDLDDDELIDDDDDQFFEEEGVPFAGDGAGGGGISLGGTGWDKKALEIAEEVAILFNGELGIYAFRTLLNEAIQIRIERLTNSSGSPSMTDIESFSTIYRNRLDEAEASGLIPSLSLEVSSPGVERVLRLPDDLKRFKDRNLYVKYMTRVGDSDSDSSSEKDGVFRLISYDSEIDTCTWGLADVRVNREKAGKGRPLSKKMKEWRLVTPLDKLLLVRFYSEI